MTSVLPIFVSAISVADQRAQTLSCQVALPTCTYVMLPQRIAAQSSPPSCGGWANEFIMSHEMRDRASGHVRCEI